MRPVEITEELAEFRREVSRGPDHYELTPRLMCWELCVVSRTSDDV